MTDRTYFQLDPAMTDEEIVKFIRSLKTDVRKHAGPIHPGTGTDQSVHGSGGTGTRMTAVLSVEDPEVKSRINRLAAP